MDGLTENLCKVQLGPGPDPEGKGMFGQTPRCYRNVWTDKHKCLDRPSIIESKPFKTPESEKI